MTKSTGLMLTPERRAVLLDTICKGARPSDFSYMLVLAEIYQLDPFTRQIYCTPAGIIIGRDGYLAIAHRSGHFAGLETTFVEDENGDPISSTSTAWRDDMPHPFVVTCHWKEYYKKSPAWDKYKHAMMRKCSEKEVLKLAFCITGLYTSAEIGEGGIEAEEAEAAIHAEDYTIGHTVIDVKPEPVMQQKPEPAPQKKVHPGQCPICGCPSMSEDDREKLTASFELAGYGEVPEGLCRECGLKTWNLRRNSGKSQPQTIY